MTAPRELLASLRDAGEGAEAVRGPLAYQPGAPNAGERAALRAEVARELAASLHPGDRPLARWLLEQEIAAHEDAGDALRGGRRAGGAGRHRARAAATAGAHRPRRTAGA